MNRSYSKFLMSILALLIVMAMVGVTAGEAVIQTTNGRTTVHGQATVSGTAKEKNDGTTLNAEKEVHISLTGPGTIKVTIKEDPIPVTGDDSDSNAHGTAEVTDAVVDVSGQIKGTGTVTADAFVQSTVNMNDPDNPTQMTAQTTINSNVSVAVTGKGSSASASSSASGTATASGNLTDETQLFVQSSGSTHAEGSAKSSSPSGVDAAGTIQNTAYADQGLFSDINDNLYEVTSEVASGVFGYGSASGKASAVATNSRADIIDPLGIPAATAASNGATFASGSGSGDGSFEAVSGIYSNASNDHPDPGFAHVVTDISARSSTKGGNGFSASSASSISCATVSAQIPDSTGTLLSHSGGADRLNSSATQKGAGSVNSNVQKFTVIYASPLDAVGYAPATDGALWQYRLNVGCVTAGIDITGAERLVFNTNEAAVQVIGNDKSFTGSGSASESMVTLIQQIAKKNSKPKPVILVTKLYEANAQASGITEAGAVSSAGTLLAVQPYGALYLTMENPTTTSGVGLLQCQTEPFLFTGDLLSASWIGSGVYGASLDSKGSGKASAGYGLSPGFEVGSRIEDQQRFISEISESSAYGSVSSSISFGKGAEDDPAAAAALIGSFALADDETAVTASLINSLAAAAGASATANAMAGGQTSGSARYEDIVNKTDLGNITLQAFSSAQSLTVASAEAEGGMAASFGGIDAFSVALSTTHAVDNFGAQFDGLGSDALVDNFPETALAHSLVTSGAVVVGEGEASGNGTGIADAEAQNIGRTPLGTLIRNLDVNATIREVHTGVGGIEVTPGRASSLAEAEEGFAAAANVIGSGSFAGYNKSDIGLGTGYAKDDTILIDLATGYAFDDDAEVYAHGRAEGQADASLYLEGHSGITQGSSETFSRGLVEDIVRIVPPPPTTTTAGEPPTCDPLATSMIASSGVIDINAEESTGFLYDGPGYAVMDTSIMGSTAVAFGPSGIATGHAVGETASGPADGLSNLYRFGEVRTGQEVYLSNSSASGDINTEAEIDGGVAFAHGDMLSIDFVGYDPTTEDTITPLNYDRIDDQSSWLPHMDEFDESAIVKAPVSPEMRLVPTQVQDALNESRDGVESVRVSYIDPTMGTNKTDLPDLPEQPTGSFDAVLFHLSQSDATALAAGEAKAEATVTGRRTTEADGELALGMILGLDAIEGTSVAGTLSAKAVSDEGLAFSETGMEARAFTGWNISPIGQSVLFDRTEIYGTQLAKSGGDGAAEATGRVNGSAEADNSLLDIGGTETLINASMASIAAGIVDGSAKAGEGRLCDPLAMGIINSGGLATVITGYNESGEWIDGAATLDEASFIGSASFADGSSGSARNTINPLDYAFTNASGSIYYPRDQIVSSSTMGDGWLNTYVKAQNGWGLSVAGAGSDNHVSRDYWNATADDGSVLFGYTAGVGENSKSIVNSKASLDAFTESSGSYWDVPLSDPLLYSSTKVGADANNTVAIKGRGMGKSLNFIFAEQNASWIENYPIADAWAGFGTELAGSGKASVMGNITEGTGNSYAFAGGEEAGVEYPRINTEIVLLAGTVPPYADIIPDYDHGAIPPFEHYFTPGGEVNTNTLPYYAYYWDYYQSNSDNTFQPEKDLYVLPYLPPV